jgi:hypothetical protein
MRSRKTYVDSDSSAAGSGTDIKKERKKGGEHGKGKFRGMAEVATDRRDTQIAALCPTFRPTETEAESTILTSWLVQT